MKALAFALSIALALGFASHAAAQPEASEVGKQAALPRAQKGLELFDAGRYDEAIAEFERAEAFYHAPSHLYYIARAHEKLGHLLEAQRRYGELLADTLPEDAPPIFHKAQKDAREALTSLVERIPTVSVRVDGVEREEAIIGLDGQIWERWWERPQRVNPGKHALTAHTEGKDPIVRSVTVLEGQHHQVVFDLAASADEPAPIAPQTSGSYIPAIVSFGIGGAGLILGGITGGMSLGKVSDLEDRCPTKQCAAEDEELGDEATLLGNVSTVGFIVGGAGVAAGIVFLIWRPGGPDADSGASQSAVQLRPRIGAGYLGVDGTF